MSNNSISELKSVVKDTLEQRGVLGQIKARIRAEVFNALEDRTERKPALSNENLIINELVREYFEFNKYNYTNSVLLAESGQPSAPMDREFLLNELNVQPDESSRSIPILYSLVAYFLQRKDGSAATDFRNPGRSNRGGVSMHEPLADNGR